jgi:hypothetical protein
MSSIDPDDTSNPERNLTPAETDNLGRLETVVQDGLAAYVQVANALAEIRDGHLYRDSHGSFETYVLERWGVNLPSVDSRSEATIGVSAPATSTVALEPRPALRSKPCEALAEACEQTLSALAGADPTNIEIRLAIRKHADTGELADGQNLYPWEAGETTGDHLLPTLRWLMTQASGTVGAVANELESRAADIGDNARAQLGDDVAVLEGELAVVKGLLAPDIDWDSELRRLLRDELPPIDTDTDPEDDE